MITVSLNEIRAQSPCEDGWKKLLKAKGGASADMDAQFPITDILESNGLDDTLWVLRCRPEHSNLWRKYAVWAARQVEHLMEDPRSVAVLDVAWRHSEGQATDEELAAAGAAARSSASAAAWGAAWSAAGEAAWAAAGEAARSAAGEAAWAAAGEAARSAQQEKIIRILEAGEWVDDKGGGE